MNLQISLAMVLTLCLSNAVGKENVTFGEVLAKVGELAKQPGRKAYLRELMSKINEMMNSTSATESSSNGLSATPRSLITATQTTIQESQGNLSAARRPVTTQTNQNQITSTKPSVPTPPDTTQPTANKTSSKPSLATTPPDTTQPTANKTSSKPSLATTPPDTTQSTANNTSSKPSLATTPPDTTQSTANKTSSKPSLATTPPDTTQPTANNTSSKPSLATTPPDTTQSTANKTSNKTAATQPNIATNQEGESGNPDTNNKSQRGDTQLSRRTSSFPVFFMLILVAVVAGYFAYHNRTKIHRFIKESYGRAKQTGTAYVKVKLEDEIELPREANRQYIY